MARFDVFRSSDSSLLLDCQTNTLAHLNTRFVVPLMPPAVAPVPGYRLNPRFDIDGADYVMVTQFAGAVPVTSLGKLVVSLNGEDMRITGALDMLIYGI